MKRVIAVLVTFVLAILIVQFVPMPESLKGPYKAEVVETWQPQNTPFRVRVDRHAERGGFGPITGAYYVLHAESGKDSNQWREIMTVRHDDPNDIPREQLRFSGDKVGYFFLSDSYAVTNDAGESWRIVDICKLLPSDLQCRGINDLRIDADGKGEVEIFTPKYKNDSKVFETTDFGRTWRDR